MSSPKLHIICGMCGCNDMLKYQIGEEINDDTNLPETKVYITCNNCGTLTGLEETINEEK